MTKKYLTLPAVMAGALGMGSTIAWAAEPTTDELLEQIQQLQDKVNQLESKQNQALGAREVDATIDKVLRDAEKRSQMLQAEGFTAGWDNGFWIRSADGAYSVNPYAHLQFRHVLNYRDEGDDDDILDDDDEDIQTGFEVRRAKFGLRGTMFTPDLEYNIRWESDQDGGGTTLEEAVVKYQWADQWAVFGGQFKDLWNHEELVSSSRQLGADRSLVNELIGGGVTDYVQGVGVIYGGDDNPWRFSAAFHDGFNTDNTNFVQHQGGGGLFGGPAIMPNFGLSGRVEYLVQGNWNAYGDFSAIGNEEDLLVIGGGVDWTQDGSNNIYFHTVDAQWETGNLGVYGAYVGAYTDPGEDGIDSTFDTGFLVQAGYMLDDNWEVFGRFDMTIFDDENLPAGVEDTYNEITAGVNYYWHGHRAKFTFDVTFLPDGIPTGTDLTGLGFLASDDEDQFVFRSQFQLLI